MKAVGPRFAYVWEFYVKAGREAEFERCYGAKGAWAELFRCSSGYIETLLLRDHAEPLRYLTIDRWESKERYQEFRKEYSREFVDLDRECDELTTAETSLGEFTEMAAQRSTGSARSL